MLEIAPTLEHEIVKRAEANGLTTDQYLSRLLSTEKLQLSNIKSVSTPETPEQTDRRVRALLSKWQAETGVTASRRGSDISKTLAELSAEWATEDADLTDEEIAADRAFWANYEQAVLSSPGVAI